MSKFAKGRSWIEQRILDSLSIAGTEYTVNLLARKGTGVQGFRVTLVCIPHEGGADLEVDLPNAATTADVHRLSRELTDEPSEVIRLCTAAAGR